MSLSSALALYGIADPGLVDRYDGRSHQYETDLQLIFAHEMKSSQVSFSSMTSTDFGSLHPAHYPTSLELEPHFIPCNCSVEAFEVLRRLHERSKNLQIPFDTGRCCIASSFFLVIS